MKERNKESQLESIAKFTHGALFAGHLLGIVYNLKKRRYASVALHTAVATYDLVSALRHSKKENYLSDKIREGL